MSSVRVCVSLALAVLACVSLVGCAQDVGDIDRTQPNATRKADLDGVWYFMETVVDVPAQAEVTFEGETSKLEKVVWKIEEDLLIAYRAYPLVPGADDVERATDYASAEYFEEPVAVYAILSHFDVRRDYDPSTGEQGNVLDENSYDRPWYEREYMRVDWSRNLVTNFDFVTDWFDTAIEASFVVDTGRDDDAQLYTERDDAGALVYFDLPRRLLVQPDLWGCLLSSPWYAALYEDCAPAEVRLVSSFAKTPAERDYEPLAYGDQMMSRFGFFRSERYVYDPERGVLESTRSRMANRHDIWTNDYERDAAGEFARDADGGRVSVPIERRTVRTVPYYLNEDFSPDPALRAAAADVIAQWNAAGQDVVAQTQGAAPTADVFVLCNNPVQSGDAPACGAAGFAPRPGDLRYSTLTLITTETQEGLLGYGPAATDPETGEIVSGRAYIYGAAVNTYASYALDVIRLTNGDLAPEELIHLGHVREQVLARAAESTRSERVDPGLRSVPVGALRAADRHVARRQVERTRRPRPYDEDAVEARLQRARDAGISSRVAQEEYSSVLEAALGDPDAASDARLDPTRWLTPTSARRALRRQNRRMARSIDPIQMLDSNVSGIAEAYAGRTDYDEIYTELRAQIFEATALHEVGHTVGLRHNFQGSYDALNFFDQYWDLRTENLIGATTMADLFELTELTPTQVTGRMREYQYSSIMDYGMSFQSDLKGLGRYDRAALMFGYSAGTSVVPDVQGDACAARGGEARGDSCVAHRDGLVEVFAQPLDQLGAAGQILSQQDELGLYYEDPIAPHVPYLERWHYSTVMRSFPRLESAFARRWERLDSYLEERDAGFPDRYVRVPYLFCSDEWEGALLSCHVFDSGADAFEITRSIIDDYRAYYYFDAFKRDRFGWEPWNMLFSHFYRTFLPLSDIYQSWYLSPDGYDDVMDDYYWLAVTMGFNLFAEALATPQYGTYCTDTNGELFNLSDDLAVGPDTTSEFYRAAYCDVDRPYYEVSQGDGRRHFTSYDVDSGYNFAMLPLEAGHYWTTLAATWALFDPEAYVLGSDGDAGTYAISYYDIFDEEIDELAGAVISEDFGAYSPVLRPTGQVGENLTGSLRYQPAARVYDPDRGVEIDPETGESVAEALGPRRLAGLCEPCERSSDCNGYTGDVGGTYCQPLADGETDFFCVQDCTEDAGLCADDEVCDSFGNCVPESGSCEGRTPACSASAPLGQCAEGLACVDGACVAPWPIVQSDATFSGMDDLLFYGMLYTTASWSTRYNDGMNVQKLGGAEAIEPGPGFTRVTFTDPIGGDTYAAVVEDCDTSTSARCEFGLTRESPAARMVRRGAELASRYDDAVRAYWEDDGSDADRELLLYRRFARAQYELENHIEKINDIRAIFAIFGRVY